MSHTSLVHLILLVSLRCESASFQPGEGLSRGLLRDYEPSDAIRMQLFEALVTCHVSRVQVSSTSGDDTEADKAAVGGDQESAPPRQDSGETFPGF